jgi:hypothetical protein
MTETQATLVAAAEDLLGDAAYLTYSATQLKAWINDGIREISQHFPIYSEYSIDAVAGAHGYELESNVKGVTFVQYPVSQVPPRYLKRKLFTGDGFYEQAGFYDFIKHNSADSANPPFIIISDTPASESEDILVGVTVDHSLLLDTDDECTVPDRLIPLLLLFVRWKAFSERAAHQMNDPSFMNPLAQAEEINAQRAEQAYTAALQRAISSEAESGTASWKLDRFDRVY